MTELLLPLYWIAGGFGVLIALIVVAAFIASRVAAKRQERWLKAALKEAIFQSTPHWINRRNIKLVYDKDKPGEYDEL